MRAGQWGVAVTDPKSALQVVPLASMLLPIVLERATALQALKN